MKYPFKVSPAHRAAHIIPCDWFELVFLSVFGVLITYLCVNTCTYANASLTHKLIPLLFMQFLSLSSLSIWVELVFPSLLLQAENPLPVNQHESQRGERGTQVFSLVFAMFLSNITQSHFFSFRLFPFLWHLLYSWFSLPHQGMKALCNFLC